MSQFLFSRYIGIDYSGAKTPCSPLKGLQVYTSSPNEAPCREPRLCTRRGIAEWLAERLEEGEPTLVGIDHGFSFPLAYFEKYSLRPEWFAFLEDFRRHWPTHRDEVSVEELRAGAARTGNSRWRRLCELRAGGAKSVFHFDVPGSVAKSTHAGLPWLLYLKERLGERVHLWPFEGWVVPAGRSVIAEAYPSLWSKRFDAEGRTQDEHDAFSIAAWMREIDAAGRMAEFLRPRLTDAERIVAEIEGWILGVM